MILLIDSSGFQDLKFGLADGKKGFVKEQTLKIKHPETQKTLGYLDKFLKANKVELKVIDKIIVVSGPGSFTGIRVGLSMALAFSFAQNIPLYSIAKDKVPGRLMKIEGLKLKRVKAEADPDYGAEPNITFKKNNR
ncbi:MAG: hypothetical protein NVSMB66_2780 [Candidatus Doudnabacteria bacterium]